ncbi:hypothetical protein MSAN_02293200 [Mycena sanguinolenta]|uniref:Uncharacterized protein n=1 Tax=Mycena sanguinolenta TaxID=230812 RepID=A0A8H7CGL2_9AGAR|nr:hypothetical protein MSAN_02293200 [Mycena sanguinolenta]
MSVPEDIFSHVVDAVAARTPRCLPAMALASRQAHGLPWQHKDAVVSRAAPGRDGRGSPLVTYSRFVALLRDRPDEMEQMRHLHICSRRRADAFEPVFETCPGLVTLWLDHTSPRSGAPSIVGLSRLHHLRELTIPMTHFAHAALGPGVVLPSVTHVHFGHVVATETLHLPALAAAFPRLTHVGFESDTLGGCARRVAEASERFRVLVRVARWCEHGREYHPRIVCMVRLVAGHSWDWLKRASPGWNASSALADIEDAIWDQWTMVDAVLEARKDGHLLETVVSNRPMYYAEALGLRPRRA